MAVEFEIMQHARMTLARSPPEGLGVGWDAEEQDALISVLMVLRVA